MTGASRNPGAARVSCTRHGQRGFAKGYDVVVVEEPLELRLAGKAFAALMRTPGDDRELALGFFFSEGWIRSRRDVGALVVCGRQRLGGKRELEGEENVVDLRLPAGVRRRPPPARLPATSSCGVCGKQSIEEVLARTPLAAGAPPGRVSAPPRWKISPATLTRLPELLRRKQAVFQVTGALHAAALFDPRGNLLVAREDIGRHNAVDKVIGWAFLEERLPLRESILQVSGRTSFEIVQKACAAGIPCIAGVSGVSSLALELARRAGITLVGFVRGGSFSVYSGAERVAEA